MPQKTKEAAREYSRQWRANKRQEDPEYFSRYNKEYVKNNQESLRQNRIRYETKPETKERRLEIRLRSTYQMSLQDYKLLLEKQNGCCAICKESFSKNPHVDHSHKTGKVRGLLCGPCNRALGMFADRISSLQAAIFYLRED